MRTWGNILCKRTLVCPWPRLDQSQPFTASYHNLEEAHMKRRTQILTSVMSVALVITLIYIAGWLSGQAGQSLNSVSEAQAAGGKVKDPAGVAPDRNVGHAPFCPTHRLFNGPLNYLGNEFTTINWLYTRGQFRLYSLQLYLFHCFN